MYTSYLGNHDKQTSASVADRFHNEQRRSFPIPCPISERKICLRHHIGESVALYDYQISRSIILLGGGGKTMQTLSFGDPAPMCPLHSSRAMFISLFKGF